MTSCKEVTFADFPTVRLVKARLVLNGGRKNDKFSDTMKLQLVVRLGSFIVLSKKLKKLKRM